MIERNVETDPVSYLVRRVDADGTRWVTGDSSSGPFGWTIRRDRAGWWMTRAAAAAVIRHIGAEVGS